MTHQEVKALAGHRAIPPWIMKLVSDAIAIEVAREREAVEERVVDLFTDMETPYLPDIVKAIRARGEIK